MSKINIIRIIATGIIFGALSVQPAVANTIPEDVRECRAQMSTQNIVDMSQYRLKFQRIRGNSQGRTLRLLAMPRSKSAGERFMFYCKLEKNVVVALESKDKQVLYALKQ